MTPLRLKLPATSANLGPGFDALGLAMRLYLEIEAVVAPEMHIVAGGRDAALVGSLDRNLMLETFVDLAPHAPALHLSIRNGIPLGMGCGSSAAALLAGVFLANHFGELGMTPDEIVAEACRREGHPDNVAACFYGGLTASAMVDGRLTAASFGETLDWRLLIAMPSEGLATTKARAMLPETYSKADAVANVQATALLVSAFALDRPELLAAGTRDRIHQPYRSMACPLLPLLMPLAGAGGIFSVTLSGAGPSVLLISDPKLDVDSVVEKMRKSCGNAAFSVLESRISGGIGSPHSLR
jgi:homoserine kinase